MEIKEGDKAKCCERGAEYIRWFVNGTLAGTNYGKFTGWGMMVEAYWCLYGLERDYSPVNFCPFCGKRLEN